ncbi:MAG: hypothetical protein JW941_08195, partial [Candidatus Coatesbacteria bacterium]|nr:hypothetical protein [Candidatus Coatesbacteria bacterium]
MTIPVVTPSSASPVLAKEAQYGRNLPGELVRHFTEYIPAAFGDLYFGVFTTTGKLHLKYYDASLPGDIALRIVRTYDSGNSSSGGFSTGWTLNYCKRIEKNPIAGTLSLSSSTGDAMVFTQQLFDFRRDMRRDSESGVT